MTLRILAGIFWSCHSAVSQCLIFVENEIFAVTITILFVFRELTNISKWGTFNKYAQK